MRPVRKVFSIILVSVFWASTLGAHEICAGPVHACASNVTPQAVSEHCKKAANKILQPAETGCDCAHLETAAADMSQRADATVAEPAVLSILPIPVAKKPKYGSFSGVVETPPKGDPLYLKHQRFLI